MSTPFNPDWLNPGAAVDVSIDTIAAYHSEVLRLRAALAEPVQEPVAWLSPASQSMIGRADGEGSAYHIITTSKATGNHTIPLYTAPPQRKPLTEEEIERLLSKHECKYNMMGFARAIERAHGIGEKK